MSLINKIFRQAILLQSQINANILSKCLSNKCGDENSDQKNDNNPCLFCSCCNCPCGCDPCARMYDDRKYGHCLPGNNVKPDFETLPNIPSDIFRCTVGEKLGPQGQASKCCLYRNPEYFSFHHMTYYDMHLILRYFRQPSAKSGRKPP